MLLNEAFGWQHLLFMYFIVIEGASCNVKLNEFPPFSIQKNAIEKCLQTKYKPNNPAFLLKIPQIVSELLEEHPERLKQVLKHLVKNARKNDLLHDAIQAGILESILTFDKQFGVHKNCEINITDKETYGEYNKKTKSPSLANLGYLQLCPKYHRIGENGCCVMNPSVKLKAAFRLTFISSVMWTKKDLEKFTRYEQLRSGLPEG